MIDASTLASLNAYAGRGDDPDSLVYTDPAGHKYRPFSNWMDRSRLGVWLDPTAKPPILRPSSEAPAPAEVDPNGVAANAPGSKLDAGKARPALVLGEFPRALAAVVDIGTFGAKKYTPRGWLSVPDGQERYADAAFRHQLKVWQGEKIDDGAGGTGGLHKAQVIWNLLAELELELRNG